MTTASWYKSYSAMILTANANLDSSGTVDINVSLRITKKSYKDDLELGMSGTMLLLDEAGNTVEERSWWIHDEEISSSITYYNKEISFTNLPNENVTYKIVFKDE